MGDRRRDRDEPGGTRVHPDVIIIGAGPAGAAAAIQIARRSPELAGRTLLLDAAYFPRPKLCGGGVVPEADRFLSYLDVSIDVPAVAIDTIRFEYEGGHTLRHLPGAFRVVRREEFDHALVRTAQGLGISLQQGEPVRQVRREGDGIVVVTTKAEYHAKVVIGADGSNSLVRRSLIGGKRQCRFVALEVVTPRQPVEERTAATAVFDFRPAALGLQGYYWDFPCVVGGQPRMNRGIGGAAWAPNESLKELFETQLEGRDVALNRDDLEGATAPFYDPSLPQSAEHVLLAGDAVGVDRWFGEGISVAIGTGILAAHSAVEAFESGDFSFANHRLRVRGSAVGEDLRRKRISARSFYRRATSPHGVAALLGRLGMP